VLTRPTDEEIHALAVTSRTPHGQILMKYLERMVADVDTKLRSADVPGVYRLQGRSEALLEFTGVFRDAVALHNKAENRAPSR